MEDMLKASEDANYEAAVALDGEPTEAWPVPTDAEHEAFKTEKEAANSQIFKQAEASNSLLGKYLVGECSGEWEGSKEQKEYINMQWIKAKPPTLDDFTEFRVLGRGGFGLVQGVCRDCTGVMLANKIQNKPRMKEGKAIQLAFEEREALVSVKSNFVVTLHYAFQDKDNIYLVLDLLSGGDLQFHLNKEKMFSEDVAKYFLAATIQGIGALHDAGWMYRDLKPENILLSDEGKCKITDLGLAIMVGDGVEGSAGTRGFYAPEMITKDANGNRQTYTQVVDFWSLGCVAYAFFDGQSPFYDQKKIKKYGDDMNECINEATKKMKVEYDSSNFSNTAESFCEGLLTRNPAERLGSKGWKDLEKHPFYTGFDFKALADGTMKPPFVPSETLNAKDLDIIGEHEGKGAEWTDKDEKKFKDWIYVDQDAYDKEIIESLEWAKENGDLRDEKKKSSACVLL